MRPHAALSQRYTLLEILFLLGNGSILATVSGQGMDAWFRPHPCSARTFAKISAQDLQSVADGWRADNANRCPTFQLLEDEKQMSAGSSSKDPWGSPWEIDCEGESTLVFSAGPDHEERTADDIAFPPAP
jgi:hypothetical protein